MSVLPGFGGGLVAWAVGLLLLGGPAEPPPALPSSALPLELLGTMVNAAAPHESACLVHCTYPAQRDATVRPGQQACDLAVVREIRRGRIVIHNLLTDRPELMAFPEPRELLRTRSSPSPLVVTESTDGVTIDLTAEAVEHYLANLPELLSSAFAAPRIRDAKNGQEVIEGFELGQVKEAGLVDQLGLRNGDVILDLNGEALDGLPTVMRLFGQIQNMPQARMTVLRNGQKVNFTVNRK
jgi:hypothetical protein